MKRIENDRLRKLADDPAIPGETLGIVESLREVRGEPVGAGAFSRVDGALHAVDESPRPSAYPPFDPEEFLRSV